MLTSLASGPIGALDDDPLTSPSFSRPTADSRSYRRSNAQVSADGTDARVDDPPAADYGSGAHAVTGYGGNGYPGGSYTGNGHSSNGQLSNGHPSGGYTNGDYANGGSAGGAPPSRAQVNGAYQVPDYADPGYAYAPAPPAASPAAVTQPAERYSAPTHTPAQGNPYGSYVEPTPAASYPSVPPAGYQDRQADGGLPGYPGDHRGYQEPVYDPAGTVAYPGPAGNGAAGPPVPPGPSEPSAHPSGAGQFSQPGTYPDAGYDGDGGYGNGYPSQAPYADSYGTATAGHAPGYPAASYPADQYGQDGYGGYPAGQG